MKIKLCASVVVSLVVLILIVSIPQARAQFVVASWDFPDAYGQGIEAFEMFENSSGAWVRVGFGAYDYSETEVFDLAVGAAIKLICYTWFNSTLTGAVSEADGERYQQHDVSLTAANSSVIFSQQNFTYVNADDSIDPPMWYYSYYVILDIISEEGQFYTATVTYEIWW